MLATACGASTLETDDFGQPRKFEIAEEAAIEDTPENREILSTINEYRQAMEARDAGRIKKLVSTAYYENASSTDDASDDYGNERIDELLTAYLQDSVQEVRYDMQIMEIKREANVAHVDYVYYWSFRYRQDGRDHWSSDRDVNRLTLVEEQGSWKIASGL